jgi:hypothetical protein
MGLLALRPGDSLTILLDGFVNRLQDSQFPSFLLFKLRGFELLPRWDFHPLFMPAFAGRTLIVTNLAAHNRDALPRRFSELAVFDARLYIRVRRIDEPA